MRRNADTAAQTPLDARGLLELAVLMAVHDNALSAAAVAERVTNLAAPGFAAERAQVEAALQRLTQAGCIEPAGDGTCRASDLGRARAAELGARTPGSACDSTRICLLMRLCLDGLMPAGNRSILVQRLLAGADPDERSG